MMKKIDEVDIMILAELTDINAHTEARLKLAGLLSERELMRCYNAIKVLHDFFGSISNELLEIRDKLDKKLFLAVEEKCSLDEANKIKQSF